MLEYICMPILFQAFIDQFLFLSLGLMVKFVVSPWVGNALARTSAGFISKPEDSAQFSSVSSEGSCDVDYDLEALCVVGYRKTNIS